MPPPSGGFVAPFVDTLLPLVGACPADYPPEAPIGRRFSGEEVIELAARARFAVGRTSGVSGPHFVSPLTGRGKVERVLAFAAQKIGELVG